ncbi:hypothetical protein V6R21_15305 [Limibacter armeniacum]|uniref:hypothetical protein n=1 Tax=Limibacter armeniacum TaxID=466084 RepID=UPI002FE57F17
MNDERIECPKCKWEPDGGAYWTCYCGCNWNTFSTYGKCPECGKVHKDTQCPACQAWSPHPDWYLDLENISIKVEEKASAQE